MKTNKLFISKALSTALVATLTFALADAHAVSVNGANVTASPGNAFNVAFDFDFGADTGISSFGFDLTFDSTQVTFAGLTSAKYQGITYSSAAVEAALAGAGLYSQTTDAAGLHATWFALDQQSNLPLPALHLSGPAELIYSFTLSTAVPVGAKTDVGVMLTYSDEALNPIDPVGHTVTVAAVPEPAIWVLLAGGLGVISGFARRGESIRSS